LQFPLHTDNGTALGAASHIDRALFSLLFQHPPEFLQNPVQLPERNQVEHVPHGYFSFSAAEVKIFFGP
jgi:hypothetical protein